MALLRAQRLPGHGGIKKRTGMTLSAFKGMGSGRLGLDRVG